MKILALGMLLLYADAAHPARPADSVLETEAAQMILIGSRGDAVRPGEELDRLVCGLKVGGILLFEKDVENDGAPRNIRSPEQLKKLTTDLQALAESCGNAPLLIAVDVEGGLVNRLSSFPGMKNIKSHAALGKLPLRRTQDEARRIGKVMRESGTNWTLAPVVDVNLNAKNPVIGRYGRSFSDDPEIVTEHAQAFIRGLRSQGILNCIKHYPGHGSSTADSHLGAVDVTETSDPEIELLPYRTLIARGAVDCVMTAHIFDRKADPEHMMTFSQNSIAGTLRNDIGFEGVVLSDDLQMKAVSQRYKPEEAAVRAIQAGNDMIILSNNRVTYDRNLPHRVLDAIVAAVDKGEIPRTRLTTANERIRRLKAKLRMKGTRPEVSR